MNVQTNVQAGQDLRFPAMDETSGTVKPVDLDAARELCANAEMGPWTSNVAEWNLNGCDGRSLLEVADIYARTPTAEFRSEFNAAFCAAARTLLPRCLDEIQALRERVAHLTRAFRVRANYRPEGK